MSPYQKWSSRADKVSAAIVERAREVARAAGLDGSMPFLHAHNALVSRDCGEPWREVDYSLARKVLWLEKKAWEPKRIVSDWARNRPVEFLHNLGK